VIANVLGEGILSTLRTIPSFKIFACADVPYDALCKKEINVLDAITMSNLARM
jgi:hypothetical protein